MPVITYAGTELSDEKKTELIKKLTETVSEVTGTPAQFMTVLVQEYAESSLGMGGETVTEIKAHLAEKS